MHTDYPPTFARGIKNEQHFFYNNHSKKYEPEIAMFDDFVKNDRTDGKLELSINWCDDDGAVRQLFNQESVRDGCKYAFAKGIATFDTNQFKMALIQNSINEIYSFERKPITGNLYHGNILMKDGLEKPERNRFKGRLITSMVSCLVEFKLREE